MRFINFDADVIPVLIQRGWSVIAGAITLLAIPLWLSKIEQGYYYTFLSLIALQVFFELGLNTVIVQFAGHEAAKLHFTKYGEMHGNALSIRRLQSLVTLLRRWYQTMALLFFILICPAGYWFFSRTGSLTINAWMGAWIGLVFATTINIYLSWQLALVEGIGCVQQVARLRLIQSMLGYTLMWIALAGGAGLYAVPLAPCVAAVYSWYRLRYYRLLLDKNNRGTTKISENDISWRQEILPLQWRIALSWISGYFIFNAFTPLIFAHLGAAEAGRFGLSLTIFASITNLGTSWASSNISKMTGMIARHEWADLNSLFKILLRSSFFFTSLTCTIFILIVEGSSRIGLTFAERFSELPILLCLAVVALANSFISTAAIYMRSYKIEPMLMPSIVGGILNFGLAYYGSMQSGKLVALLYAGLTCFVSAPWTWHILKIHQSRLNSP